MKPTKQYDIRGFVIHCKNYVLMFTIGVHSTELHSCRPSLDAESSLKLVLIDSRLRRSEQCERTGDVVADDATGVVGVDILARLLSRLS